MSDPKSYAGYVSPEGLHALGYNARDIKQRTQELMQIQPGHRVLDVGCGPGIDTLTLAQRVGPSGHVVGIDYDKEMIERADQHARDANLSERITHIQGDAATLPFEDDSFDSCRSERVIQHLVHPEQALEQMVRVTRPGGWIVVADPDQGTASIDSPEIDTERKLMRLRAETIFNNGFAGRQHYRHFVRLGLEEISVQLFNFLTTNYTILKQVDMFDRLEQVAVQTQLITPEQLDRWRASLTKADDDGTFFVLVTLVMVAGRKPSTE